MVRSMSASLCTAEQNALVWRRSTPSVRNLAARVACWLGAASAMWTMLARRQTRPSTPSRPPTGRTFGSAQRDVTLTRTALQVGPRDAPKGMSRVLSWRLPPVECHGQRHTTALGDQVVFRTWPTPIE